MADDQATFDVKIGLQVEGGDSAAQKIGNLSRQIAGLERDSAKLRGFANALTGVFQEQRGAVDSARALKTKKDQAAALKPVIEGIRSAVKGMPSDLSAALGIDSKSITAAGKNISAFDSFSKKLGAARTRLVESAATSTGRAESLVKERDAVQAEAANIQKIRDRIARAAVEDQKATELQKTQATVAGAQQRIAAAKQAAVQTSQVELQAARQQLGSALRSVFRQAATDPMGGAQRPTLRELQGTSALPMADRRLLGQQPTTAPTAAKEAAAPAKALDTLASAANEAASALKRLPQAVSSGLAADKKALADFHKQSRMAEAQVYPRGAYARRQGGGGGGGPLSPEVPGSYDKLARSADGASRAISGIKQQQDAITGQIKNVLGMAFGYQAIHAVAQQLNQVFGHLRGGVISFNSMLEQANVGFTTLFANQKKQAEATNALLGENTVGIDYLAMGYKSASDAAAGTIETIRQFANVTPFRFAELQESTLRMRAFGFDMAEILRVDTEAADGFAGGVVSVGNAVAALGGGADAFRRITYALGQMKQAGRVYQNDMMQLANAGIGGYKYIAEKLMKEITTDGSGRRDKVKKEYATLYKQLESNAIETVRRLTTNGQVSGEAAARAIMEGLNRDFGGGMVAQSKTFVGAFSTVADMSQSLVADAFKPLYDSIRDVTYEVATFLQKPEVRERAKDFGRIIAAVVKELKFLGPLFVRIGTGLANEFGNAMAMISSKTSAAGQAFTSTFGSFFNGLKAIVQFLANDYGRALAIAFGATKMIFAFAGSNPFLSQLIIVITTIGMLKTAIDQNILGIGDAFNRLVADIEPIIAMVRDELIPVLVQLGGIIVNALFVTLVEAFRVLEPAIRVILVFFRAFLDILRQFQGPLSIIAGTLGVVFAGRMMVAGIVAMQAGMMRFAIAIERAASRMAALNRLMQINQALAKTSAASTAVGAAGMGRFGGIGMGGAALGVGIVGTMGVQALEGAGVDPGITNTLNTIFGALTAFGALKSILPADALARSSAALVRLGSGIVSVISTLTGLSTAVIAFGAAVAAGFAAIFAAGLAFQDSQAKARQGKDAGPLYWLNPMTSPILNPFIGFDKLVKFFTPPKTTFTPQEKQTSFLDFRAGEREGFKYLSNVEKAKSAMKDLKDYNKLLVNQQKNANAAQAKYNALLEVAKQQLNQVMSLFQEVVTSVLEDLTSGKTESPYALDKGVLLDYEELLNLEQELGFTQFENAQGITRSFGEYKDILDSILPLSTDDTNNGEISLKQVTERLKIEQERRKEQERIKALAQAEYDLGLATLQQYDESIDPLQRAINLRQSQAKYEEDITNLRLQGLEDLVDQATNSRDWARLSAATKKRLEDYKKGQQLILDEMKRMFEDYNTDIAAILADPKLSDAQKKNAIAERLDLLKSELESKFGITAEMITDKIAQMQASMDSVMDVAGMKGIVMEVKWGETLVANLASGGFNPLMSYLSKKYDEIVDLAAKIRAAVAAANAAADPTNTIKTLKAFYQSTANRGLGAYIKSTGYDSETAGQIRGMIAQLGQLNDINALQGMFNQIMDVLANEGITKFASGGIMSKGQLSLVGEKGPELVLPQSRGLVLNNSISSRLLGMLSGGGDSGSTNNVTINVNNPVIRSDNDIRKLAQEISRAQASQFRTEGGRLY